MRASGWLADSVPKRDRLIGCGAFAYALVWAGHVSVHLLMYPWSVWGELLAGALRWITFVAMLLGCAAGIVGLGLVGLALVRGGRRRDAGVQHGAAVAAGAYLVLFLSSVLNLIGDGIGGAPSFVAAQIILGVVADLVLALTWLLLAWALRAEPRASRGMPRQRRLAWTGLSFAAYSVVLLAVELAAASSRWWDLFTRFDEAKFWAAWLALGAAALAAAALFRRARSSTAVAPGSPSMRNRLLAYAGILLFSSAALQLLSAFLPVEFFRLDYGNWPLAWWYGSLPGIRLAVAALLATLGFLLFGGRPRAEKGDDAAAVAPPGNSGYNPRPLVGV